MNPSSSSSCTIRWTARFGDADAARRTSRRTRFRVRGPERSGRWAWFGQRTSIGSAPRVLAGSDRTFGPPAPRRPDESWCYCFHLIEKSASGDQRTKRQIDRPQAAPRNPGNYNTSFVNLKSVIPFCDEKLVLDGFDDSRIAFVSRKNE